MCTLFRILTSAYVYCSDSNCTDAFIIINDRCPKKTTHCDVYRIADRHLYNLDVVTYFLPRACLGRFVLGHSGPWVTLEGHGFLTIFRDPDHHVDHSVSKPPPKRKDGVYQIPCQHYVFYSHVFNIYL